MHTDPDPWGPSFFFQHGFWREHLKALRFIFERSCFETGQSGNRSIITIYWKSINCFYGISLDTRSGESSGNKPIVCLRTILKRHCTIFGWIKPWVFSLPQPFLLSSPQPPWSPQKNWRKRSCRQINLFPNEASCHCFILYLLFGEILQIIIELKRVFSLFFGINCQLFLWHEW